MSAEWTLCFHKYAKLFRCHNLQPLFSHIETMEHNNRYVSIYQPSLVLQLLSVETDLTHFSSFYPCNYKGTNSIILHIKKHVINMLITIYEIKQHLMRVWEKCQVLLVLSMGCTTPSWALIICLFSWIFEICQQPYSTLPRTFFSLHHRHQGIKSTFSISAVIKVFLKHLHQLLRKIAPTPLPAQMVTTCFSSAFQEHSISYITKPKEKLHSWSYNPAEKFTVVSDEEILPKPP